MKQKVKKDVLWSKAFILICIAFLCQVMGMNILNNTISLYVGSLGLGMSYSGILASTFAVAAILSRFVSGYLSDRMRRRTLIVIGASVFAAATLGMAYIHIYAALIVFRFIQGLGYSTAQTNLAASGSDVLPDTRMGEGIGYMGLGNTLATAFGTTIALPILGAANNFDLLYTLNASCILVTVIIILSFSHEKNPNYIARRARLSSRASVAAELNASYKGFWKFVDRRALPPAVVQFFFSISTASITTFLTVYAKSKGFENVGFFFTCSAVSMFIARLTTGRISDRYNPMFVLIPSVLSCIGCYVILSLTANNYVFFFAGLLFGFANGAVSPTLNSVAVKRCDPLRFGAANATYYIGVDAGVGLGGLLWGNLIDKLGFGQVYTTASCVALFSLILAAITFRRMKSTKTAG